MKKLVPPSLFLGQQGLTILEVLISATILAMIGISIVNVTNKSIDTKDKVLSEDKEFMRVETAMSILQWDLTQIYSPLLFSKTRKAQGEPDMHHETNDRFPQRTEDGLPIPAFKSSDRSTFEFLTMSNRRRVQDSKQSLYTWVRYSLRPSTQSDQENEEPTTAGAEVKKERAKSTFELVRTAVADDPYSSDSIDPSKTQSFVVLRHLTNLTFEYWDPKDNKFVENLTNITQGQYKQQAIRIKFSWMDAQGAELNEQRIFSSPWPQYDEKNDPGGSTTGQGDSGNPGDPGNPEPPIGTPF